MDVIENILNCSPSLPGTLRAKIKEFLAEKLAATGNNINNYDMELRTMRKYVLIENGKLNLSFPITGKTKDFNSEIIVADNDVFIPIGVALGFLKTPLISGTTFEKIENQDIIYFPSQTVFTYQEGTNVPQYQSLESVYYSQISYVSGSDQLVSKFDARHLKRVPKDKMEGQYYYADGIYADLTEFPILIGGDGVEITFAGPTTADTASAGGDPATEKTYAVLMLTGFNIFKLAEPMTALQCKCIR